MPHLTQPATITRLTDIEPRAGRTTRTMPAHTLSTRVSHQPTSTRPASGSATQTQTSTSVPEEHVVLRLRGAHDPTRRRIQWAEDVVDNEGLGRKSSKVCCIYHAPKEVGESSDESDSSSSSDDDSSGGEEDGGARMIGAGKAKGKRRSRKHEHEHGEDCEHGGGGKRPSPNAYERMTKSAGKKVEMVKK